MTKGNPQFEAFFAGRPGSETPVLAIIGSFAASFCQMTPQAMWQDPMRLAGCLEDVHALAGGPVICGGFDLTLLSEALDSCAPPSANGRPAEVEPSALLGCGRLPVVLGAWERLVVTVPNTSLVGMVPGVATVAAQIGQTSGMSGSALITAGAAVRTFARALLEHGVHHIMIAEEGMREGDGLIAQYRSISNVVHFFGARLFLLAANATPELISLLPVDVYMGPMAGAMQDGLCGGGIPVTALAEGRLPRDAARAWLAGAGRRFLATDWEVLAETPAEMLAQVGSLAQESPFGQKPS